MALERELETVSKKTFIEPRMSEPVSLAAKDRAFPLVPLMGGGSAGALDGGNGAGADGAIDAGGDGVSPGNGGGDGP